MDVLYVAAVLALVGWVALRRRISVCSAACPEAVNGQGRVRVLVAALMVGLTAIAPTTGSTATAAPANATFSVAASPVGGNAVREKFVDGDQIGFFPQAGFFDLGGGSGRAVVGNTVYQYIPYDDGTAQLMTVDGLDLTSRVDVLWEGSRNECPNPGGTTTGDCYVGGLKADALGHVYLLLQIPTGAKIVKFDVATGSLTNVTTTFGKPNWWYGYLWGVAADGTVAFVSEKSECVLSSSVPSTVVTTISPSGTLSTQTYQINAWELSLAGTGQQYVWGQTMCLSGQSSVYSLEGSRMTVKGTATAGSSFLGLMAGKNDVYVPTKANQNTNNVTIAVVAASNFVPIWSGISASQSEAELYWYNSHGIAGPNDDYIVDDGFSKLGRDGKVTFSKLADFNVSGMPKELALWNVASGTGRLSFAIDRSGVVYSSATSPSMNVGARTYSLRPAAQTAQDVGDYAPGHLIGFDPSGRPMAAGGGSIEVLDAGVWQRVYGSGTCGVITDGADAKTAGLCIASGRVAADGTIYFVHRLYTYPAFTDVYGRIENGVVRLNDNSLPISSINSGFRVGGDGAAVQAVTNHTTNASYVFGQTQFNVTPPSSPTWSMTVDSGFPAGFVTDADGTLYAVMQYYSSHTDWTYRLLMVKNGYIAEAPLSSFDNFDVSGLEYGADGMLYVSSTSGLYKLSDALAKYVDIPPAPTWKDDPSVAGDATYEKPADSAEMTWTLNADKSITANIVPATTFFRGTGTKSASSGVKALSAVAAGVTASLANTARSVTFPPQVDTSLTLVPVPGTPSITDDPLVKGDAKYVLPANTAILSWTANGDGSATVTVVASNTKFSDGSTSKTFPAPVDVYTPPPTTVVPTTVAPTTVAPATLIPIPAPPEAVDDTFLQGDAKYLLPANTPTLSWVLNGDGSVTVRVTAANTKFADGSTTKTFPQPSDIYVGPTTVPPPTTVAMESNVPITGGGGVGLLPIAALLLMCGGLMIWGVRARSS